MAIDVYPLIARGVPLMCGDAITQARAYFAYMPQSWRTPLPSYAAEPPARALTADVVPATTR